jgi:hypothetical protein
LTDAPDVTKRPGGRAPSSIVLDAEPVVEQVPPLVVIGWLYPDPTVPLGRESETICKAAWACKSEVTLQIPAKERMPRARRAVMT